MRKQPRRRWLVAAALALALQALIIAATLAGPASGGPSHRHGARAGSAVPGELIVGFKPSVAPARQRQVLARVSAREKRRFGQIRSLLASVGTQDVTAAIQTLERDPSVLYAEPNFLLSADNHGGTPNDPAMHALWGLDNFGQVVNGVAGTPDADIDATEAWGVSTGSRSVVVGVIDTGVDFGHPDLAPTMWINPREDCPGCRANGVDDDGNGYVDDWRGWDFVNHDNDPFDDAGHGTHVAGTIGAAGNNGIGISGVSWNVSIMALKFLSASGTGSTADAVSAILYASAEGAVVTNNSWGGEDFSQALRDAISAVRCSAAPQVWVESPRPPFEILVGDPVTVEVLAGRCGDPAGLSVNAEANGEPLALVARGDGLYTGSFTPTAGGPVTISASATADGTVDTGTVSGMAVRRY